MLLISISAVFMGTAAAVLRGNMQVLSASLAMFFAIFLQISAQLMVAKYTLRHTGDTGRHSIDDEETDLSPEQILNESSRAFLILACTLGLAIISQNAWWTLIIAAIVLILFFFGYMSPKPLSKSPATLLLTFLLFGPICVIGTSLIQSSQESSSILNLYDITPALFLSVISGLYAVNIHLIHLNYSTNPKRSIGRMKVGFTVNSILIIATVTVSMICLKMDYSYDFIILSALSFLVNMYVVFKIRKDSEDKVFRKMENLTLINTLIFSILTFILFWVVGIPDDSTSYLF